MDVQDPAVGKALSEHDIEGLLGLAEDITVPLADLHAVREALWDKYRTEVEADPVRRRENKPEAFDYDVPHGRASATVRTIVFDGLTMRFTVAVRGVRPGTGYPLVIALHGGGGTTPADNNGDWTNVQTLWAGADPGIYVAVRSVVDAWNMHFGDQAYPLYDRLIENMVALEGADPDRVVLLGFSAGGDGVYQITPRLADRFAATAMMAGHPNGMQPTNYRNVPFLIEMGELDTAYKRNLEAARFDALIGDARTTALAQDPTATGAYVHATYLHPGGDHNSWIAASTTGTPQPTTVIANLPAWLASQDPDAVGAGTDGAGTVATDTAAVPWLLGHTRTPYPARVVWDTRVHAGTRNGVASGGRPWLFGSQSRAVQSYWLDVGRRKDREDLVVEVALDKPGNAVRIMTAGAHLRVLLTEDMLDLGRPVRLDGVGSRLFVQPAVTLKTMVRTLVDRGDQKYAFPAQIVLERTASGYDVVGSAVVRLDDADGVSTGRGTTFTEFPPVGERLTRLVVHAGDVVDAITPTYGRLGRPRRGGPGGGAVSIELAPDEYIVSVSGVRGTYFGAETVVQLTVATNKQTLPAMGSMRFTTDRVPFTCTARPGEAITAFTGQTYVHTDGTEYLSALAVGYQPVPPAGLPGIAVVADGAGAGTAVATAGRPEGACFTAEVAETRPIAEVNVSLTLSHPDPAQLRISLISPGGTRVVLADGLAGGPDCFDGTTFDDRAGAPIVGATAPFTGRYRPTRPLAAFAQESGAGLWRLCIQDSALRDAGVLHGWKLYLQTM